MKKKISLVNLVKEEMKITLGGKDYIPFNDPEGGGSNCHCICSCGATLVDNVNMTLVQHYPTPF